MNGTGREIIVAVHRLEPLDIEVIVTPCQLAVMHSRIPSHRPFRILSRRRPVLPRLLNIVQGPVVPDDMVSADWLRAAAWSNIGLLARLSRPPRVEMFPGAKRYRCTGDGEHHKGGYRGLGGGEELRNGAWSHRLRPQDHPENHYDDRVAQGHAGQTGRLRVS